MTEQRALPDREAIELETHRIGSGDRRRRFRRPRAIRCARSTRARWSSPRATASCKAALFRFVDVAPACRSLDDLARHLRGFLEEVPDAPMPITAAMKIVGHAGGPRRARRGRRRRRQAHGPPVHRRRDAEGGARRAARALGRGVASSVDLLGEATVTQAEADRYAERCDRRARASSHAPPQAGPRARCSSTTPPARCRAPTCRSRSRR